MESQIPHKFLPFSRYVFINMGSILVLGGLDDTHAHVTDFFTNYCYELKVLKFQANDEMYVSNPKSSMLNGRGCFAVCLNEQFVFTFGGVVGIDQKQDEVGGGFGHTIKASNDYDSGYGLTALCEKYDIENDQWYEISPMPYHMKNSSSCALSSDSIYLFGGKYCGEFG